MTDAQDNWTSWDHPPSLKHPEKLKFYTYKEILRDNKGSLLFSATNVWVHLLHSKGWLTHSWSLAVTVQVACVSFALSSDPQGFALLISCAPSTSFNVHKTEQTNVYMYICIFFALAGYVVKKWQYEKLFLKENYQLFFAPFSEG